NTERITTRATFTTYFEKGSYLSLKNSISLFDRRIEIPDYVFAGNQIASFNEGSYHFGDQDLEWIAGVNLWVDIFDQEEIFNAQPVDYNYITSGIFLQNTWKISNIFSLESGLRT